ncbi:putative bifunctional diguanylate cyclase/phosphodiesterase [Pseudomonas syringae]|uniref:GGDEF domain-containing protein n=2 Tax=Pseudomonas syringae TaxID=317 RepID=A0A0L8IU85_PSESX|nr:EAL domain-containing protein [Pseudomonas syringae]EGH71083.1 GGDEF domain-containing protein [Pseudomonas syringae pv. aceris str. M302273]KOG04965.1 GGDEF domain-containing protein [Pseudomonas syringae pv. aceris]KPW20641.1 GGDEF domain-containing protein [Pseudomonas syringae pv. aceris]MCF4983695.1 EAL domain-containing protein [Pseudomonas syringae]MCF5205072.1 EAL domain-containing protein [Pseudomonas syringae]
MDWLGLNVFADPPADVKLLIDCSHNLFLVALAYGVACAACFATLDIADRVIQVDALKSRRLWKALGALCLAGGVWAMHFISMLAFQAPLKIAYDLSITLISLLIVLITALVAMRALTVPELTLRRCLISAVVMGVGISVMHYLGMSAMRSTATQYYEPRMFALSILVAVLSSIALLTLPRHLRQYNGMFHQMFRYAVSLLLGAGLLTMHLMGMKALRLVIPEGTELHGPATENSQQLGLTIAAIALLIIAGSISAAMADKKLQGKEHDLQRVNALLTQLDQARVSLQQVAHYDPLTNLINRRGFNQIFAEKLQEHTYNNGMLAVMFLDIDHFKRINDSLGHDAGDELLKVIADRIRGATRVQDVVARFGGDEFCILLSIPDYEEARHLAHRVMQKMKETIALAGRRMVMTTSIGIAVFPRDGSTCDELLKHADLALYQSKDKGRNGVNFFNPALKTKASLELQLEEELRNALREGTGLQVYYQPIVDMRTGHVAKLEALVRWNHPHHGLLVPARFIGIAEANGLIAELDNWVLRRACHDLRTLHQEGLEQLIISVNCSALTLGRNELVEEVERALADADAAPGRLELEVTENALMGNISNTILMLKHIRSLGVSLSIDDFGTGYSSLAYLKRLPLDTLKIDRSFIIDIPQSPQDMEIVQAILVMAHTLRLKVVTEGVETQAQLEFLRQFGSDYVQGYMFSRPQPLERILPLARQMNEREASLQWSALPPLYAHGPDIGIPEASDVFAELSDSDDFASHRPVRT